MIPNLTWGADFAGLVRYLVENRDHETLHLQGVSSIAVAADEMAAVAALNDRATNKLLHLSLSAAHQDGQLAGDDWLHAVNHIEGRLGLRGHLRVVVRHRDKTHDHVHVFWCTVSIDTGQTPSKRWFLKKGCAVEGIGPHALSDAQIEAIDPGHRARRTYDFRVLARCQDACRSLERELKLRQLRSPTEAAAARAAGEIVNRPANQRKRSDRVGSMPLIDRADEIRAALDTPDWPSKQRALAEIGLEFEPVFRTTKKGDELRGMVIFDALDRGNRLKASDLDTSGMKYSCRWLEERHHPGSARLVEWWPTREIVTPASALMSGTERQRLKAAFDLLCLQHQAFEREKKERRKRLRRTQKDQKARARRALMRRRKEEAMAFPADQRRAFYRRYSIEVSRPAMEAMAKSHAQELRAQARAKKPSWRQFLDMSAAVPGSLLGHATAQRDTTVVDRITREREFARSDQMQVTIATEKRLKSSAPVISQDHSTLSFEELQQAYYAFNNGKGVGV